MTIGEQTWMVENLRVKHTNTGEDIDYYKSAEMKEKDGLLYNSKVINDDLAPIGWSIPSAEDYNVLFSAIGTKDESIYRLNEHQESI